MVPGEMTVTVSKKEVVAAALPMQDHWLPLSNLDLLLPPLDVGVFFCYKKSIKSVGTTNDMVGALKVALAQTLVSYYAFAGEVVVNSAGEPEILCNNSGVDFVEASADIELCQLDLHNPDFSIQGKLVPSKKRGVLAVQVTELKCGAMVVACTFDHRVADAYSANMFLVSWAETARSSPLSSLPSFRRSVLSPRRPLPAIDPSFNNLYVPVPKLPPAPSPEDGNLKVSNEEEQHINDQNDDDLIMTSRIYYVTADQLSELQQLASSWSGSTNNGCKTKQPTKLESFSSLLWKLISKFAISNEDSNRKKMMSRMGIVVDGRGRLGDMEAYFGNVLSISFGERSARELAEMPLGRLAQVVHQFLEEAATKEHFLGLIDWVEARRPEPNMAKIYFRGQGEEGWPAFVVSSGQRFPITEVDFGWGKPVFGSYHFPWGGDAGYVMPMPSPLANGDWIVYLHLPKSQLDFVESEAAHVFHPLTPQYLSLN